MTEPKDTAKSTRAGWSQWLTKPVQLPGWFFGVMFTITALRLLRVLRTSSMAELAITVTIVTVGSLIMVLVIQRLQRRHPKAVRLEDKETQAAKADSRSLREFFPKHLRIMRWPRIIAIVFVVATVIAAGDLVIKITA